MNCSGKLIMANVNVGCPKKGNCLHYNGKGETILPAYSIRNRSCENYMFHKEVLKEIKITGKQSFICTVNKENVILSCDPVNTGLINKNLKHIYNKYKHKLTFELIGVKEFPVVLYDDMYEKMKVKNSALEHLKTKFDCEL